MPKTWLGLDLALSVATGTACLGRYAVPRPGPVLVYLAEDALTVVRERVEGMARHRGLELAGVDLHVITVPTLRLDREPHRQRLLETARRLRPRLLLLDPLVRLHGIDENNADRSGRAVGLLPRLQRQLDLSVILVHHTRKNAAGGVAAGQGLRGSSDLHAFGDSNLYLRRVRRSAWCCPVSTVPHRLPRRSTLELVAIRPRRPTWKSSRNRTATSPRTLADQVLAQLPDGTVLTRTRLRDTLWPCRTSVWAASWSPWKKPAASAIRRRAGNASLEPTGLPARAPFPFPL